jgi:hypothetical protein
MDAEAYDRAWRIEQRAEELFKRDYPSGSFARRLPHFRSPYPIPSVITTDDWLRTS